MILFGRFIAGHGTTWLCLVFEKFLGKCTGKKIKNKNKRKEKVKENKK